MKIRYEYTQIQCVDVAKEGNIKRVPGLTLGYPDVICRTYFKQFGIGIPLPHESWCEFGKKWKNILEERFIRVLGITLVLHFAKVITDRIWLMKWPNWDWTKVGKGGSVLIRWKLIQNDWLEWWCLYVCSCRPLVPAWRILLSSFSWRWLFCQLVSTVA